MAQIAYTKSDTKNRIRHSTKSVLHVPYSDLRGGEMIHYQHVDLLSRPFHKGHRLCAADRFQLKADETWAWKWSATVCSAYGHPSSG